MNLGMRYQLHECTTTSLHHILMSGIWRLVKHYNSSKGVQFTPTRTHSWERLSGHRAVIEASYSFGRFHTAEMTAAGIGRACDWGGGLGCQSLEGFLRRSFRHVLSRQSRIVEVV